MNDDLQSYIEPELEARIVALVLGESSVFEAGSLEVLIDERPELRTFKERIEAVHGVVSEAHRGADADDWKLSGEKREAILSRYRETAKVKVFGKSSRRRGSQAKRQMIYACAACLALALVISGVVFSMGTIKYSRNANSAKYDEAPVVMTYAQREKALAELDEELIAQSDLVQDHRKDLTVLVQQYGIPYFDGDSNSLGATEQDMFRSARHKLADFQTERDSLEIQLRKGVEKGAPAESLDVLKTKSELVNRQIDRMSEMVDDRQSDTVDLSLRQHTYTQAKETYEQSQEMLRAMKLARVKAGVGLDSNSAMAAKPAAPIQSAATALAAIDAEMEPGRGLGTQDLDGVLQFDWKTSSEEDAERLWFRKREGQSPESWSEFTGSGEAKRKSDESIAQTNTRSTLNGGSVSKKPSSLGKLPVNGKLFGETPDEATFTGLSLEKNESRRVAGGGLETLESEVRPDSSSLRDSVALGDAVGLPEGSAPWDFELTDKGGGKAESKFGFDEHQAKSGAEKNRGEVGLDDISVAGNTKGKDRVSRREVLALPAQIEVVTKSVEVLQNNIEELGFDQLDGEERTNQDFIGNVRGAIPGIPTTGNVVTGGIRSGEKDEKKNLPLTWTAGTNLGYDDGVQPFGIQGAVDSKSLEKEEMIKRQTAVGRADEALMEGRKAYAKGDYEDAVKKYKEAATMLPAGTATADRKKVITDHLADGSVALTQRYRRTGKYEEARQLLTEVEKSDPGNAAAMEGLEYLDDPIRTSPSLSDEHSKNVDKVRQNLYKGEGLYDLGLYDKAEEEFKKVLRVDPYNKAARRWMERASSVKSDYYRAAYDSTRAEMLMEVDREWELSSKVKTNGNEVFAKKKGNEGDPFAVVDSPFASESGKSPSREFRDSGNVDAVPFYGDEDGDDLGWRVTKAKLNQIILPELNLENTTLEEALEFIQLRTVELDSTTLDSMQKGIEFSVRTPQVEVDETEEVDGFGAVADPNAAVIKKLNLKNVPAGVALQYLADAAKMRYRIEADGGVTMLPLGDGTDADIIQRRWGVSPEMAKSIEASKASGKSITTVMEENGVSFPPNTSASYFEDGKTLIVRNTPTNLDLINGILDSPDQGVLEGVGERTITAKGDQIMIPEVRFNNTTVAEALDFVRLRAIDLDNTTLDETQKGVNLIVDDAAILSRVLPKIDLKDVSLNQVLERIGDATGASVVTDEFAIRITKDVKVDTDIDSKSLESGNDRESNRQANIKLNQIILPEINLKNSTLAESLEFLRLRFKELDRKTDDDSSKGLEIIVDDPSLEKEILEGRSIAELKLKNIPLRVAVNEVARLTGCKYRVNGRQLIFYSDPKSRTVVLPEGFEISTAEKSDSTFSLNVSDVSFKLAKSALAAGNWPDASKVRPEEFVNALDYDDSKPSQSEKVACVIEQGAHPFMQQRNLMRIAMSTASLGRNASTPLRLTILLDQSGSMERADRAESVKRAFALLAAQLTANDEVTLVGFARTPRLLAERMKGDQAGKLAGIVANPLTEGGTNLEAALSSGLQLARQQFVAGAQNRIILLTDGAANLGDALPENLARQVEAMRKFGIAFDACGVGADGLNDEILSSLTKQGDGRYYFLDRPEDADEGFARQIAGALRPAAKNVKVQILFNPDRVSKFKLYGFEKHKLKKEDFRNDAVDAAEMAAEESGVALYHFEAMPEGRGDIGTVSVRFFDMGSKAMVERTWAIPYEADTALFAEAEPALRLASVAGLFAEKLKGSPVGERVELKRLRQEAELLKPDFDLHPRYHELKTMLQQAGD